MKERINENRWVANGVRSVIESTRRGEFYKRLKKQGGGNLCKETRGKYEKTISENSRLLERWE